MTTKRVMITFWMAIIFGAVLFAQRPPTCGVNCPDVPLWMTGPYGMGYFFMYVVYVFASWF